MSWILLFTTSNIFLTSPCTFLPHTLPWTLYGPTPYHPTTVHIERWVVAPTSTASSNCWCSLCNISASWLSLLYSNTYPLPPPIPCPTLPCTFLWPYPLNIYRRLNAPTSIASSNCWCFLCNVSASWLWLSYTNIFPTSPYPMPYPTLYLVWPYSLLIYWRLSAPTSIASSNCWCSLCNVSASSNELGTAVTTSNIFSAVLIQLSTCKRENTNCY